MEVFRAKAISTKPAPPENFTGPVFHETLMGPQQPKGVRLGRVWFAPGGRTNWHTHVDGQTLYIVAGKGRVGTADGTVREVSEGDVVQFPPGEKHWHGSGPNTIMCHVAIGFEGATTWLEPVSDEDYSRAPTQ